jgi:hypothetical protein
MKQLNPSSKLISDTSMKNKIYPSWHLLPPYARGECWSVEYDVNDPNGRAMALTTASDEVDRKAFKAASEPKDPDDFATPRDDIAYSMDICTWFLHKSLQRGWPSIDKDMITQVQQPGFKGGITWYALPVDGMRNTGLTMLHEVRLFVAFQGNIELIDAVDTHAPRRSIEGRNNKTRRHT